MRRPEQQIHMAVVDHLAWRRTPGTFYFHVPNGGYRTRAEAGIFKRMGVVKGCPDLCIIGNGRAFFIELKSAKGRLSDDQKACHEALREAGATVGVAGGIDDSIALLETWGLLR
jgi:hypothetical protein